MKIKKNIERNHEKECYGKPLIKFDTKTIPTSFCRPECSKGGPNSPVVLSLLEEEEEAPQNSPPGASSPPSKRSRTAQEKRNAVNAREFLDSVDSELTHENKASNFADARRPEKLLWEELTHLRSQLPSCPDLEARTICLQQLASLQDRLEICKNNAARDIYNRNNSAGSMGSDAGELVVDFHSLYVKEALAKFVELVHPVLPVQKRIVVITGRGRHSLKGKSILRDALMAHVDTLPDVTHRPYPGNSGKLLLTWIDGRSIECATSPMGRGKSRTLPAWMMRVCEISSHA